LLTKTDNKVYPKINVAKITSVDMFKPINISHVDSFEQYFQQKRN
jgi:hypothetical protein